MNEYSYQRYSRKPKKQRPFSSFCIGLIGAFIGGVLSIYIAPNYLYGKIIPVPTVFLVEEKSNKSEENIIYSENYNIVASVAEKSMKSVVGITIVQEVKEFFWSKDTEGIGSGVIIDSNGYILTNSHVVGDGKAKEINVLIEGMESLPAKTIWYDETLDLAIIKVEANNLPIATLGDSDELKVGELAIAIGNPLGLDFQRSVTSGIISGLKRSIKISNTNIIDDLIQTDASINPGNSGGPLLNQKGEVIGLNTAKITSGEGLGFAIPINLVKSIVEEVIEDGGFSTVYIGFQGIETQIYENQMNIDLGVDSGVVIIEITPNSPAEIAELKPRDIILKIEDNNIENMSQLRKILYKYRLGDRTNITINREGKQMVVEIEFIKF